MAQPTPYDRQYDFSNHQTSNPTDPLPANQIDAEFNAAEVTLDGILTNLALIQRDDGALANDSVGPDQIAPGLVIGINEALAWVNGNTYAVNDGAWVGSVLYICTVAHISDENTNKPPNTSFWQVVVDLGSVITPEATQFPSGSVSSPGLSATGDPDTGLYIPAADQLAMSLGGEAAILFRMGDHVLYSGTGAANSNASLSLRSTVASGDLTGTELWNILFQGLNDTEQNVSVVRLEGHMADNTTGAEDGRMAVDIKGNSVFVNTVNFYHDRTQASVPVRYSSAVGVNDLTDDKDLVSIEKHNDLAATSSGAPNDFYLPLLGSIPDDTYPIVTKIKSATTLQNLTVKSESGTCTFSLQKNGANITNFSGLSVTNSVLDATAASDGTQNLAEGDRLDVVITDSSSLLNVTIDIGAIYT